MSMMRNPDEIEESDKEEIAFCGDSHCYTSWGQQLHCPLGSSGQCAVCSVQFNLHCTALPTDFSGQFVWAVQLWAVLGSSWAVLDLFLKG